MLKLVCLCCRLEMHGSQTQGRTSRTGASPSSPPVGLMPARFFAAPMQPMPACNAVPHRDALLQ